MKSIFLSNGLRIELAVAAVVYPRILIASITIIFKNLRTLPDKVLAVLYTVLYPLFKVFTTPGSESDILNKSAGPEPSNSKEINLPAISLILSGSFFTSYRI